jgi:glycerol-3-phosphate acyltransferase PlsY
MHDKLFPLMALLPAAYLLGSIPTAVWTGKWFFGKDVRDHGSGNAGATNVYRQFGALAAIIVLIVDALKGAAAVGLAGLVSGGFASAEMEVGFRFLLGLLALLGHVFPVFAGFRGGKGIATLAGILAVLFPVPMLACLAVFLLVFLPTRIVSAGSILAALAFPVLVVWVVPGALWPEVAFSLLVAVFVIATHRRNIHRLLAGQENRLRFRRGVETGNAKKPE